MKPIQTDTMNAERTLAALLFCLLFLLLFAPAAFGDIPRDLKGSWVLDAEATEQNIMASPQLKPQDIRYITTVLKRMSGYVWTFEEGVITSFRGTKEQSLPVVLKQRNDSGCVFEGQLNGQPLSLTVEFVNDGTINIRSSATNDMDLYLWKRGVLDQGESPRSDTSLAIELMEQSLTSRDDKFEETK